MRIVFRVDASQTMGVGHIMRCSAIMEEAVARSISCVVVGSLGGLHWLEERLKDIGAIHLENPNSFHIAFKEDVLVIDSYEIPTDDQFIQPDKWRLVVTISDEVTPNYVANLVIRPSIETFSLSEKIPGLLSGARYIPFRKSISKSKVFTAPKIENIVVFGGGSDQYNLALTIAQGISKIKDFENAVFFSTMRSDIETIDERFEVRDFGPMLDKVLENAELVFTTASTSSLEIVAREIPLGVCCVAENQISNYEALTKNKLAAGIGRYNLDKHWEINWGVVTRLISDSNSRQDLVEASRGYVDLFGSKRIIDKILEFLV